MNQASKRIADSVTFKAATVEHGCGTYLIGFWKLELHMLRKMPRSAEYVEALQKDMAKSAKRVQKLRNQLQDLIDVNEAFCQITYGILFCLHAKLCLNLLRIT